MRHLHWNQWQLLVAALRVVSAQSEETCSVGGCRSADSWAKLSDLGDAPGEQALRDASFSFRRICLASGLRCKLVEEVSSVDEMLARYDKGGGEGLPVVVRRAVDLQSDSSPLPVASWSPAYLNDALKGQSLDLVMSKRTFMRGYGHHFVQTNADTLFGGKLEPQMKAYAGAVDLNAVSALLLSDANKSVPDFMKIPNALIPMSVNICNPEDPTECMDVDAEGSYTDANVKFLRSVYRLALWAAAGGEVDSGLHFDEHQGGYLLMVRGIKEMLLFPHDDSKNLYMNKQEGHELESTLFVGRLLGNVTEDVDDGDTSVEQIPYGKVKSKYRRLWHAHPMVVTLHPGDLLYIPHRCLHEVHGLSGALSLTSWVNPDIL